MPRLTAAALLAGSLALPGHAAHAAEAGHPLLELATGELAFGFCPGFAAGDGKLADNPHLVALGFNATPTAQQSPAGTLERVAIERSDRDGVPTVMTLGGVAGRMCQITVTGGEAGSDGAAAFRTSLAANGYVPDPDNNRSRPGFGEMEAFKAPGENGKVRRVQLIRSRSGDDMPLLTFNFQIADK